MSRRWQVLSGLSLRLIAMALMVVDHVAALMIEMNVRIDVEVYYPMRIIGRIVLPIFLFLALESVRYTKNFPKYLLRLAIMGTTMLAIGLFINFAIGITPPRNIFIDLIGSVTLVYFLLNPKLKNWFYLLPAAYITFVDIVSYGRLMSIPEYLRAYYGTIALTMMVGFYFAYYFARKMANKISGQKAGEQPNEQANNYFHTNYLYLISVSLLAVNIIWYILDASFPGRIRFGIQSYSLLAAVFIALYNGRPGYRAKWLTAFYYLYYPLHLGLIVLVLYLIT